MIENFFKEIKAEEIKFELVRDFLAELKKKFEGGDNNLVKKVELKRVEQESKKIEKFV